MRPVLLVYREVDLYRRSPVEISCSIPICTVCARRGVPLAAILNDEIWGHVQELLAKSGRGRAVRSSTEVAFERLEDHESEGRLLVVPTSP